MDTDTKARGGSSPTRGPDAGTLRRKAEERPGIREVMRVYEDWKRVDRGMDPYRAATAWMPTTTNRSNPDDG